MPFISLTRLRLRSIRFLPPFLLHSLRSISQVKRAPGFLAGALLSDKHWTFWTMTAWDSEASMRAFIISGPHKAAMPRLVNWCDEASVTHWTQPETVASPQPPIPVRQSPPQTPDPRPQTPDPGPDTLPSWEEADQRMRSSGRPSKIKYPSPSHATLTYKAPRTTASSKITPS